MLRPRINEFPACKAVASGWKGDFGGVLDFMHTWILGDKTSLPLKNLDFLCFNEPMNFLWFKILSDDKVDTKGFEMIDFSGGLYISAIAIDENIDDLMKTIDYLNNLVNEQENFELDFCPGRYRMTQLLTSDETKEALGYGQLEVFIPIKIRR